MDDAETRCVCNEIASEMRCYVDSGYLGGVYKREEIYFGPFASSGPDIVINPGDFTVSSDGPRVLNFERVNGHHQDGIYMIRGPEVPELNRDGITIFDIFPTMLSLLGIEVLNDVDGHSILKPEMRISQLSISKGSDPTGSPEDEFIIEEHLKRLGYL